MDSGTYARGLEYQEHVCDVREEGKSRLVGKGQFNFFSDLRCSVYYCLLSVHGYSFHIDFYYVISQNIFSSQSILDPALH